MAEKEREENIARVIDFPKEVRVYGNVSHVYFEGKDKLTSLMVEPNKSSSSGEGAREKKRSKGSKGFILIVPIKQKKSELHFVKVPLEKLSKVPRAEKLGEGSYLEVNARGPPKRERLAEYKTNVREIRRKESLNKRRNDFETCFVFKQDSPLREDLFPGSSALPIANVFQFQEKFKAEEVVLKQEPEIKAKPEFLSKRKVSVREAETNTEQNNRILPFLVSPRTQKNQPK